MPFPQRVEDSLTSTLPPFKGEVMPEPDRSFVKDLKNLDRRLGVKFNGEHFVVTYDRGHGEPVNVHRINNDDGSFRQPNKIDLKILKGGDLEGSNEPMKNRLSKLAYASELMRRKAREKAREEIRAMTLDNKNQLRRWIAQRANAGKCNSEFRRV